MTGRARWWGAAAMVTIAGVAAVLSYFDGLFVAQLAGNHDWRAWLYPLLPDQLIVICLIALLAAKRRPAWATLGLGLGIVLTLAMNITAGLAHSILDAVVDGFVPVVFFVAVEVFIGYVRRGRAEEVRQPVRGEVPSGVLHAARMRLKFATDHDFKVTPDDTRKRFGLTRAAARNLHAEFAPKEPPAAAAGEGARVSKVSTPAAVPPAAAGAPDRGRGGLPRRAAGARAVPATMNGSGPHG